MMSDKYIESKRMDILLRVNKNLLIAYYQLKVDSIYMKKLIL